MKATLATGVAVAAGETAAAQTRPAHAISPSPELSDEFTRGIGVYPGAAEDYFGPTLVPGGQEYRNLALLRPAYHSSSYDYNLTAQLVTDGIKHDRMPEFISVSVDGRVLTRPDREIVLDHFQSSVLEVIGAKPIIEFHLEGGNAPPTIDRIAAFVVVSDRTERTSLRFTAFGSPDGHTWQPLGSTGAPIPVSGENYPPDLAHGNALLTLSIPFAQEQQLRYYRLQLEVVNAPSEEFSAHWGLGEVEFYNGGKRVEVGGPYSFTSAWKSAGLGEEWVYVDLGAVSAIDRVKLHWIAAASEGKIQVSNDAKEWRSVASVRGITIEEEIRITPTTRARYVRVLMTQPASADGYILSELEIFGRGGVRAQAQSQAAPTEDGGLHLAGGSWRVQRTDIAASTGEALSQPG